MKIDSSEISVVVQGKIDSKITKKCLKSIRKYLPKSEIILSTWEGENVEELVFDKVVFNKDPGAISRLPLIDKQENVNRQIVSTINGLKQSRNKYSLKIRSDTCLLGKKFIKKYCLLCSLNLKRDDRYILFKERILIDSIFTRNYYQDMCSFLFHPSDLYMFGNTTDLIKMFDIPLMKECIKKRGSNYELLYVGEQYIWLECLNKNGHKIKLKYAKYANENLIELSNKYLLNNFYVIDHNLTDILFSPKINCNYFGNLIDMTFYFKLYKNYYDKKFSLPVFCMNIKDVLKIRKKCKKIAEAWSILFKLIKLPVYCVELFFLVIKNSYKLIGFLK